MTENLITLFMVLSLASRRPSADGLAQPFQQPFQVRHALAEFAHFAPQVFDVPSQLTDVLSHILPQPAIAGQDQPGQGRPYDRAEILYQVK